MDILLIFPIFGSIHLGYPHIHYIILIAFFLFYWPFCVLMVKFHILPLARWVNNTIPFKHTHKDICLNTPRFKVIHFNPMSKNPYVSWMSYILFHTSTENPYNKSLNPSVLLLQELNPNGANRIWAAAGAPHGGKYFFRESALGNSGWSYGKSWFPEATKIGHLWHN